MLKMLHLRKEFQFGSRWKILFSEHPLVPVNQAEALNVWKLIVLTVSGLILFEAESEWDAGPLAKCAYDFYHNAYSIRIASWGLVE